MISLTLSVFKCSFSSIINQFIIVTLISCNTKRKTHHHYRYARPVPVIRIGTGAGQDLEKADRTELKSIVKYCMVLIKLSCKLYESEHNSRKMSRKSDSRRRNKLEKQVLKNYYRCDTNKF